jgi:hypothetical protein
MEQDKPTFTPINWNAGSEYNELIKIIKENYIHSEITRDWISAITCLSTDLDFSYAKILVESKKKDEEQKVKEKAKRIRNKINEVIEYAHNKKNSPNYQREMMINTNKLKRAIWDLQALYGVLFPYEEKIIRKPGDSIKRGYE